MKGWCSLLCHFFEQLEEEGGTHCCGFTFEQLEEERGSKHSLNLRLQEAARAEQALTEELRALHLQLRCPNIRCTNNRNPKYLVCYT